MLRRLFGHRRHEQEAIEVPPAGGAPRSVAAVLEPVPRATERSFLPAKGVPAHGPLLGVSTHGPILLRPGDARPGRPQALAGTAQLTVLHAGVLEHRDSLGNRGLLAGPARHLLVSGTGTNLALQPGKELQRDGGPLHLERIAWRPPPQLPARASTDPPLGPFGQGRARLQLLVGAAWGQQLDVDLGLTVLRLVIPSGATVTVPVGDRDAATVVVTASTALVGRDLRRVPNGSVALLDDEGTSVQVATLLQEDAAVTALVASGPRCDPFVSDGSLVANDEHGLAAARHAAASGGFGRLPDPP